MRRNIIGLMACVAAAAAAAQDVGEPPEQDEAAVAAVSLDIQQSAVTLGSPLGFSFHLINPTDRELKMRQQPFQHESLALGEPPPPRYLEPVVEIVAPDTGATRSVYMLDAPRDGYDPMMKLAAGGSHTFTASIDLDYNDHEQWPLLFNEPGQYTITPIVMVNEGPVRGKSIQINVLEPAEAKTDALKKVRGMTRMGRAQLFDAAFPNTKPEAEVLGFASDPGSGEYRLLANRYVLLHNALLLRTHKAQMQSFGDSEINADQALANFRAAAAVLREAEDLRADLTADLEDAERRVRVIVDGPPSRDARSPGKLRVTDRSRGR